MSNLEGQTAIVYSLMDKVLPAKITYNFSKRNENLKIVGGFFDENWQEKETVLELAKIPSREELLSRLTATLAAPIYCLESIFSQSIRNLIFVLKAIEEKNNS